MHDTTPLTVYGVSEPFEHVVQISSPLVGNINVRVEVDPEYPDAAPRISIAVDAESVRCVEVLDDFGSTWGVDMSGLRERFTADYEWKPPADRR